ncbi:putative oxidoreductase GLYR1 homolog [Trichonephila clavata]|uniref:Putative oxidoreductase GLYR1 homolog n=1 Tax=Trichonephila clavata TaxID=2740835 RepID=A0A8X6KIV8_TRICU|nr:putative oxidoreductase GLYR1 homolog [Trichonephila clavata]
MLKLEEVVFSIERICICLVEDIQGDNYRVIDIRSKENNNLKMAAKKDFKVGDLVWINFTKSSSWPARIISPPAAEETVEGHKKKLSAPRKPQHYVSFFGNEDKAWISEENIVPHSDEKLKETHNKKSTSFIKAIAEIIVASRSLIKELKSFKEDSAKSDESTKNSTAAQNKEKIAKTPETSDKESFGMSNDDSASISNFANNTCNIDDKCMDTQEHCEDSLGSCSDDSTTIEKIEDLVPTPKKIGFIFLDEMGQGIIKNLLKTSHEIAVWNRTPDKCRQFVDAGAQQFLTPSDIVKNCDITICCVSGVEALRSIVYENGGILQDFENSVPGSKGFIMMTSINVEASEEVAEAITESGGRYVEAPFVGFRYHAEEGSLLFHAAGDPELFQDCSSIFLSISSLTFFVGCDIGAATRMNILFRILFEASYDVLAAATELFDKFLPFAQVN